MCIISWALSKLYGIRHLFKWPYHISGGSPKLWFLSGSTPNLPASETVISPMEPIFALTIGTDNYERITKLSGCVADADDIAAFLRETLHVPCANITNLRNEEATAAGITAAFEFLSTNTRIPMGALIFIFYAGHGSEALPPDDWVSDEKIQTLVPYDFDPGSGSAPVAKNGLSDIKLSQLLRDIADAKGNNITVVFDCCHSGSGTRHSENTDKSIDFAARGIDLPKGTRLGADALPTSRGSKVLTKDRNNALGSHVLFSACTELQLAQEVNGRGIFTSALTTLFRSEDLTQLSYSDIIQSLPTLPSQNPQCEGINQHLAFLSNRTPGPKHVVYNITQSDRNDSVYVLGAGEAHGVTVGAEFAVYDTKSCANLFGCLVVDQISAFRSTLRPLGDDRPFSIPEAGGFALQTHVGSTEVVRLGVHFNDDLGGMFTAIRQQMSVTSASKPSFQVFAANTTPEEDLDFRVTASGGTARFEIMDTVCRDVGLAEILYHPETDSETMTRVLRGLADFQWNLRRTTTEKPLISGKIGFKCYELVRFRLGPLKPTGDNLVVNGMIEIGIGDKGKRYGFCIENKSNVPLFVSMFYFDMSDLSIDSYYQPPSAGPMGNFESIRPNGSLTVGYGSGGARPHTFYLHDSQDVDVGYLKLFLSTQYVDYSHVPQDSPFLLEGRVHYEHKTKRRIWDTMLIPIIQRREIERVDHVGDPSNL